MKYTKPNVTVLGSAVEVIQGQLKNQSGQDGSGQPNTAAYDLDE